MLSSVPAAGIRAGQHDTRAKTRLCLKPRDLSLKARRRRKIKTHNNCMRARSLKQQRGQHHVSLVDMGALRGNAPDNILGGHYCCCHRSAA